MGVLAWPIQILLAGTASGFAPSPSRPSLPGSLKLLLEMVGAQALPHPGDGSLMAHSPGLYDRVTPPQLLRPLRKETDKSDNRHYFTRVFSMPGTVLSTP